MFPITQIPQGIRKAPGTITKFLLTEPEERKRFQEKPLAERWPATGPGAVSLATTLGVGAAGLAPRGISTLRVAEKLFNVSRNAPKKEIMSAYRKFAKKKMPKSLEDLAKKSGQSVGKYINVLKDELLKAHEAIRVSTGKGLLPSGKAAPEAGLPLKETKIVSPEQAKIAQRKLTKAEAVVTEKYKAKEVSPGGALEGTPLGATVPTPLEKGIAEISPKKIKEMVKPKAEVAKAGLDDISKYKNVREFKQDLAKQLDETGTNILRDKYYYHVAEGNKPFLNKGETWLSPDAPIRQGNVFAIDKTKLSPEMLRTAPNDPVYRIYSGEIPADAIIPLGEKTQAPFDVAEKLYNSVAQQPAKKPAKPVPTKPLEPQRGVEEPTPEQ
ncbi:hypothetical protein LCGC14_2320790, partial [marine sediment metagenome]